MPEMRVVLLGAAVEVELLDGPGVDGDLKGRVGWERWHEAGQQRGECVSC